MSRDDKLVVVLSVILALMVGMNVHLAQHDVEVQAIFIAGLTDLTLDANGVDELSIPGSIHGWDLQNGAHGHFLVLLSTQSEPGGALYRTYNGQLPTELWDGIQTFHEQITLSDIIMRQRAENAGWVTPYGLIPLSHGEWVLARLIAPEIPMHEARVPEVYRVIDQGIDTVNSAGALALVTIYTVCGVEVIDRVR